MFPFLMIIMCLLSVQHLVNGAAPTKYPTVPPTTVPTRSPTNAPSLSTHLPTIAPTFRPTLLPTTSPSEEPSAAPTHLPNASPSEEPTAEPTKVQTMPPTRVPSATPSTFKPTSQPTRTPTTMLSTATPSAKPTVYPTTVPTTAAPSVAPTAYPSLVPSGKPTVVASVAPTIRVTVAPTVATVSMQVEQQVDGVSYTAYLAEQASYDSVFITTIAMAADTPTSSVKNLIVSDAASRRRTATASSTDFAADAHLRVTHGARHVTLADAVGMQYTVEMPASSGVTYEQMSLSLTHSVDSGEFTTLLQDNAATQGVPALTTASSDSVQTQDITPGAGSGGGNGSTLSGGAIAGIVIGVFAAVLILVYIGFWFYSKNSAENTGGIQNLDTLQNRASARSATSSTRSANAFIYGTEGEQGSGKGSAKGSGQGSTKSTGAVDDTKRFENPMRAGKPSPRASSGNEVGDNML